MTLRISVEVLQFGALVARRNISPDVLRLGDLWLNYVQRLKAYYSYGEGPSRTEDEELLERIYREAETEYPRGEAASDELLRETGRVIFDRRELEEFS